MSDTKNTIPENIMNAMFDLMSSAEIEMDDKTEERLEPDIATEVSIHHLELSSLIQTVSVDALAELLIKKGIITEEEYKNTMYVKLFECADLVKNFALRAAALKSIIYPDGKIPTENTNIE